MSHTPTTPSLSTNLTHKLLYTSTNPYFDPKSPTRRSHCFLVSIQFLILLGYYASHQPVSFLSFFQCRSRVTSQEVSKITKAISRYFFSFSAGSFIPHDNAFVAAARRQHHLMQIAQALAQSSPSRHHLTKKTSDRYPFRVRPGPQPDPHCFEATAASPRHDQPPSWLVPSLSGLRRQPSTVSPPRRTRCQTSCPRHTSLWWPPRIFHDTFEAAAKLSLSYHSINILCHSPPPDSHTSCGGCSFSVQDTLQLPDFVFLHQHIILVGIFHDSLPSTIRACTSRLRSPFSVFLALPSPSHLDGAPPRRQPLPIPPT